MRRVTFAEAVRRLGRAVPFRRYTVELVNGERVIVYHPELLVVEGDLARYDEADEEGTETYFDASSVARIINVVIPYGSH